MMVATLALATTSLEEGAQASPVRLGYSDIAAVVGIGGIGEASLALGARYEKIIKALPDMGDGLLGLRVGADWYSYSVGSYSWTYIPLSVTGNYHFKMESEKFAPFVGLGLGYYIVTAPSGFIGSYNSGIYFVGVVGMRYFLNPNMAFYADAGAGAGALHAGLSFKLGGGSAASRAR